MDELQAYSKRFQPAFPTMHWLTIGNTDMTEDLTANYLKAYQGRIGFGAKAALLLIDFANGYIDPECSLYAGEPAVSALNSALRLREAAHAAGMTVILTEVTLQPGLKGMDAGRFFTKSTPLVNFTRGLKSAKFATGLEPREDEWVISKQYASAFFGTSLAAGLTAGGFDTVIITGFSTSGCVRASAVDAMQYGFRTIVVSDACGDRHPAPHDANLFDINAKYGDVVSEAEAMAYIMK